VRGAGSVILAGGRGRACRVSARWRAAFARMFRNPRWALRRRRAVSPRAAGHQPGSARHRAALTDHGNSAAAPQVRVRHPWQQGGDPLIGSNGAVRGMPADAAAGRRAHCNLWSAPAHRRHTCATALLPPSMASVPTSAIPRRSPCSACPCLREARTRKQCITDIARRPRPAVVTQRDWRSRTWANRAPNPASVGAQTGVSGSRRGSADMARRSASGCRRSDQRKLCTK